MKTLRIGPRTRGFLLMALGLASSLLGNTAEAQDRGRTGDGPTHAGGVVYLAVVGELTEGSLVGDCFSFPRPTADEAVVELPADGTPRVCVAYAAFPEGDPVDLAGIVFGIDYDEGIEVHGYGHCQGDGVILPSPDWPESGNGIGMTFSPRPTESVTPVLWFILSGSEGAEFRLVPHPIPSHGGRFSNFDPRPYLEPISAYGFLGSGTPGLAPVPGEPEVLGVCCIDRCYRLTSYECAYYDGLFLGDGECNPAACVADAELGACCLAGACTLTSRVACYQSGGDFAGEGSTCEETPCGGTDR